MWRCTNVTMGVRLALVEDDRELALVFESARATAATAREEGRNFLSKANTAALPSDPAADVTVRELPLSNTLLASAVGGAAWDRAQSAPTSGASAPLPGSRASQMPAYARLLAADPSKPHQPVPHSPPPPAPPPAPPRAPP
jgi:hypothetical protein